jgi:hypothetical protein
VGLPIRVFSGLLATCLIAPSLLFAQTESQAQRGPDSGTRTKVGGIDVLPLPGLPFTGTDTIVWSRPADGGGTLTTYETAKVIRDSQGRLYRESHHFGPDQNADPQKSLYEFSVSDPVTHIATFCVVASHTCRVLGYRSPQEQPLRPVGPFDNGRRLLTRESLGNQYLDSLPVLGTLEKIAISPGAIGNDMPVTLSREFWYSPDLKTNLSVIRKSPGEGTQTITLNILSRGDPDSSAFTVPSGYIVLGNHRVVSRSLGAPSQ